MCETSLKPALGHGVPIYQLLQGLTQLVKLTSGSIASEVPSKSPREQRSQHLHRLLGNIIELLRLILDADKGSLFADVSFGDGV